MTEIVNGIQQLKEEYLGAVLCDGPETVTFGEETVVKMLLMYYPRVSYSGVVRGATFTVRDGPKVIGYGTITAKWMEPLPASGQGDLCANESCLSTSNVHLCLSVVN